MGFPTKLLSADERLVLVLRPHVKALLRPLIVLLVTAPLAGFAIGMVPDSDLSGWARAAIVVIAALVIGRWVIWPFLVWWNTVYAITDRRLVTRQGVLNRTGHDMPLSRLNDVKFSHNVIERVLGCGTLVVESAGEAGQLTLDDVPRVEQVQRTLYRLSDSIREKPPARAPGYAEDDPDLHDDGDDDTENPTRVLERRPWRRELP
jgi:uncharacterized membrane protein YdbT with pleckstrin-like domain